MSKPATGQDLTVVTKEDGSIFLLAEMINPPKESA